MNKSEIIREAESLLETFDFNTVMKIVEKIEKQTGHTLVIYKKHAFWIDQKCMLVGCDIEGEDRLDAIRAAVKHFVKYML